VLKPAYFNTDTDTINKLIHNGNYKYLSFGNYTHFSIVHDIPVNEWGDLIYISVDKYGNILGFFEASINRSLQKISINLLVKFKYKYEEYAKDYIEKNPEMTTEEAILEMKRISAIDIREFFNMILSDKCLTAGVSLHCFAENDSANHFYEEMIDTYNGKKILLENYFVDRDMKLIDVFLYYFPYRKTEQRS